MGPRGASASKSAHSVVPTKRTPCSTIVSRSSQISPSRSQVARRRACVASKSSVSYSWLPGTTITGTGQSAKRPSPKSSSPSADKAEPPWYEPMSPASTSTSAPGARWG